MTSSITFKFNGISEIMDVIGTGGSVVKLLAKQSHICPLIGSKIKFVKKIGEGEMGTVFLIKIQGMGPKKYVAKKTDIINNIDAILISEIMMRGSTLNDYAKKLSNKYLIEPSIFLEMNGGNPSRVMTKKDIIIIPYYAEACKTKTKTKFKRFDINGQTIIPKGSYLCENNQYSEYIIGVLIGELYRNGCSINFIDVFDFATCIDPTKTKRAKQYVFMDKIDTTVKNLIDNDDLQPAHSGILMIQILHAIACYQHYYSISHNDLHNDNVFIEKIKPNTIFNNQKLFDLAKDIVLDEVLGIVGVSGDNILFSNNIVFPDVPLNKEFKKSPDEVYAIFLSDLHVGSNNFLPDEFNQMTEWLNGNIGNEGHKDIAKKIKYIFIVGDLIDGLGIYPGQEEELIIKDIKEQYKECARLLKKIPSHIQLIICPGNHDAMRIAEPQLELYKDFAKDLWDMPNTIMVSNPSLVNIHSSEDFPGFDVLMYHGYSFDYYVANVDSIRNNGGYDRADLIMQFLLQKRHLAPTHTSTLYIPDVKRDPLVIEKIPDIFATGHIHKSIIQNYKNITLVCGSCWQSKTLFQEKVGHNPEPARVPILNLQTRQFKILKF